MALTQAEVDLSNMSLGRIGAKQITLAVQTSNEGVQCNLHYAHTRDSLLRSYEWGFAVKRLELVSTWVTATAYVVGQYVWTNSLLYICPAGKAHTSGTFATDLAAGDWVLVTTRPSFGFQYQYALPSDCLRFRKSNVHHFTVEGLLFLCSEQEVKIEYISQVTTPTSWDTLFYEVMILQLALNLLPVLAGTQTTTLSQELKQELSVAMNRARTVTAQERNDSGRSSWNEARLTSGKFR